jgi:hypothetical protein
MSEWKGRHEEQYNAAKRRLRYFWPVTISEYWANEFEAALHQRGQEARRDAIRRGDLPPEKAGI